MSLIHQIALTLISQVGHVTAKNLLAAFGTAEAVFSATEAQLLNVDGIGRGTAGEILRTNALSLAEKQYTFLKRYGVDLLFYTDPAYPRRLKNCPDAPILLYYKGNADLNHSRVVSIVGTRKATSYGLMLCEQLAAALQPYKVSIVSGLAYGIDVAAHRHSLQLGIPTIGVLGHGLDKVYPAAHSQTAVEMLKNGGLLTEFPLFSKPDKENFPKRNRIIAGLADVTIVVEAARRGGALITAEIANSYNRDVYAFPGKTNDTQSQGCNFLIKTNRAGLLSEPQDLIDMMGWDTTSTASPARQTAIPLGLSAPETAILELLKTAPSRLDELSFRTDIPQSKLAMQLLNLEIKGLIVSLPGNIYQCL